MKLKYDLTVKPWYLGLGADMGCNKFFRKKPRNIYLEINILCLVFGLELIWEYKK